ncbi:MAG: hypothetical protein A2Y12_09080 [Planctomycetes bacterium GWF2_42_9]|nr:MAG: hypothetical protein A2Y12_09080 [Planctomycetes bacterium GWF2_42_9]
MQTYLDCIPCFIRQSLDAVKLATDNQKVQEQIIHHALDLAGKMDFCSSPPAMAQIIHRKIRTLVKNDDPYKQKKQHFNEFALSLFPKFKDLIANSEKPFEAAIRLAIAGNIIDLGVISSLGLPEAECVINNALIDSFDATEIGRFKTEAENAKDILYLADNAGEIVFDRFLIEQIGADKITFVVKGSAVINDATIDDSRAAGLTDIVKVIDNGDDAPGTILESCSKYFQERFKKADLIISKGQGNYETLSRVRQNIYFILKAKCPVIARDIGCEIGHMILQKSKA